MCNYWSALVTQYTSSWSKSHFSQIFLWTTGLAIINNSDIFCIYPIIIPICILKQIWSKQFDDEHILKHFLFLIELFDILGNIAFLLRVRWESWYPFRANDKFILAYVSFWYASNYYCSLLHTCYRLIWQQNVCARKVYVFEWVSERKLVKHHFVSFGAVLTIIISLLSCLCVCVWVHVQSVSTCCLFQYLHASTPVEKKFVCVWACVCME